MESGSPRGEQLRLESLYSYDILDTPAERSYDDVALLAAQICGTPIAVINFVDAERVWVKARVGLEVAEIPRHEAFCADTILQTEPLVVEDLAADPRFWRNPLVEADGGFRFYAGASLINELGVAVGTICALDYVPRYLGAEQVAALEVLGRQVVTQLEVRRLLAETRRQAHSDPLTGLGNRRQLTIDLDSALSGASDGPHSLMLFDLDRFKAYNDTFGHAAGDVLLVRVAGRLRSSVVGHGQAYRMGGDAFCVLVSGDRDQIDDVERLAVAALHENGAAFSITSSHGRVDLPADALDSDRALRILDERLRAHKRSHLEADCLPARDVLLRLLHERDPDLAAEVVGIGSLARGVAQRLGVDEDQIDLIGRAAELRDIGTTAIPDQILHKTGPLTEEERDVIRRHTVLGERILAAAPALGGVAKLVRSSHECYDGSGYPDGLAGRAIPLGARIVCACDAYVALTIDRAHRPGLPVADALLELRRGAGTQFDPWIVTALCAEVAAGSQAAA